MEYARYVGSPAIDRPTTSGSGWTLIAKEHPIENAGIIENITIHAASNMTGVKVAIFYKTNGLTFSTRSWVDLGNVPTGLSEYTVSLDTQVGDYIGITFASGTLDTTNAGDGRWYKSGAHIPCTDQSFTSQSSKTQSVFGWTAYIPPPPQPWALLSIEKSHTEDGVQIVVTTNVECHLWLRHTLIKPQVHTIPVLMRGIYMHSDKRFCFDSYHDNEQEEAGDTTEHTFIKEPWPFCQTWWFYFYGLIEDVSSPSTSCIFTYHRYQPEIGMLWWDAPLDFPFTNSLAGYRFTCSDFVSTVKHRITQIDMLLYNKDPTYIPGYHTVAILSDRGDDSPALDILCSKTLWIPTFPVGTAKYHLYELDCPLLLADQRYWYGIGRDDDVGAGEYLYNPKSETTPPGGLNKVWVIDRITGDIVASSSPNNVASKGWRYIL